MADQERRLDPISPDRQWQPSTTVDYSRFREEFQQEQEWNNRERMSSSDLWSLARENVTLRAAADRQLETQEYDPDFPIEDRIRQVSDDYDDREIDFLGQAVSLQDWEARVEQIAEDRERHRKLAEEGIRGMGYQFMAGMTDEALLPLYVATGLVGGGVRGSATMRALRAGSYGAAEGAAIEAALMQTDTQRDWQDVLLGAAGGGLISGSVSLGVSGYRRLRHGKEPDLDVNAHQRDPEAAQLAQELDQAVFRRAQDIQAGKAIDEIEQAISIENLQSIDGRQALMDEPMPLAEQRMSRGARRELEVEHRRLAEQARRLREEQDGTPALDPGGTNRQRLRKAEERRARLEEIQERMAPVQRRMDEIEARLKEDQPLRDAWADISRLAQGQVPEHLAERLQQRMREDMSPLRNREFDRARELAAEATRLRQERAAQTEEVSTDPDAPVSQVGAARAEGATNPEDTFAVREEGLIEDHVARSAQHGNTLPEPDLLRRLAGLGLKGLSSTYSRLAQSPSSIMRGLGHMLLSDPQGAGRGHVPASIYQDTFMNRIIQAAAGEEYDARMDWARSKGIPHVAVLNNDTRMMEFDNQIVLAIRSGDHDDPNIMKAAAARQRMFSEALKMRKQYGVRGFENVEDHPAYWSFLPDGSKMHEAVRKYGREQVVETLTGAYMNGRYRIPERTARVLANAQYARAINRSLKARSEVNSILGGRDLENLRNDLKSVGFDDQRIDDMIETFQRTDIEQNISDRAKLSLGASISHSHNGLRMVDLIDTSHNVALRYSREASADAAIATQGFKSRFELEETIREGERVSKNILDDQIREAENAGNTRLAKDLRKQSTEVSADAEIMMESIKMMYGQSLDVRSDGSISPITRAARMSGKYTNIVRLTWNGPASIAENANALVNFGFSTVAKNTRLKDFTQIGKLRKSPELQAPYRLLGAYGQEGAFYKNRNYLLQTMDEFDQNKLEQIFNNYAGFVSNKTQLLSAFRSIQHGSEDLALRSMLDRMTQIARREITPTQRDWDNLERAGMSREEMEIVFRDMRENPEYVNVDGEQVQTFSGDNLDPALRDKLGAAMNSLLARQMQKSFVGDTPVWMNKALGQLITQFRGFSLVAIERQVAAGFRGDKIGMGLKVMFGAMLGGAAYYSRAYVRAEASGDPEAEWEKATNPATATMGIANMTPHLGILGFGMELGATVGLPVDGATGTREGVRPITGPRVLPAAGVLEQMLSGVRGTVGGMATGDSEQAVQGLKQLYGVTPLVNTAAVGAGMALANQVRD